MDPATTGALISAGSSLLSSVMGGGEKRPRIQDYIKSLLGTKKKPDGTPYSRVEAENLYDQQRLIGKMEGAKAAGIHPIVALGLNPSAGGMDMTVGSPSDAAQRVAEAGQNIGSAISRLQTADEKATSAIMTRQVLEKGDLENELLKSQIALNRANGAAAISNNNSSEMIAGQGDTGAAYIANQLTKHENSQGKEAGTPSSWTVVKTRSGDMLVPSKDFQDRAEDVPFVGYEWFWKNKIQPILQSTARALHGRRYGRNSTNRFYD